MEHILELAEKNQREAWEVIRKTDVMNIWKSVGAEINLVGSLNMGLLVKNRDVDFHIYSSPLTPAGSFMAMAKLAAVYGIQTEARKRPVGKKECRKRF